MTKHFLIIGLLLSAQISNATASSATASSSPKSAEKTDNSNQTVVNIAVNDCNATSPCFIIKTSINQLAQAVNQNLSEKQSLTLIENSILPQIDFNLMTKYVMGAAWKKADVAQQGQITTLFKQLLVYQYSHALGRLKGAQVSVDSSTISGDKQNKATVKGALKVPNNGNSNSQPVNIEYDLAKIGSTWKIYDVKIENVSIVTTYRSQFNDTVQNGGTNGIAGLIKQLQDKVNSIKAN